MKIALTGCCVAVVVAVSAPATAGIIALHSGDADPVVDEGWTSVGGGSFVTVGPVASDVGGFPAWQVTDGSSGAGSALFYNKSIAAVDAAAGNTDGWKLSTRLRAAFTSDPPDLGIFVHYFDGSRVWRLHFGTDADTDAAVAFFGDGSYTSEGSGSVHHLYEVVYDPLSATADLFVDGVERVSNVAGVADGSSAAVAWGSGSSTAVGSAFYNLVEFQTVPEPSTFLLAALGTAAIGCAAWRRRRFAK